MSGHLCVWRVNHVQLKQGGFVDESISVDAKRILLRYGAPIAVLDKVPDAARIELARTIARTPLAERTKELKRLLKEGGFTQD